QTKLLSYEKEMLGVYLTGHPIEKHMPLIKLYSMSLEQIKKIKEGEIIIWGGILTDIKRTMTRKKAEKMAIGEIENMDGKIKAIFYPSVFGEFSTIIRVGNLIFVKGRLKKEPEEFKIIVDDVANMNNVKEKFLKKIEIDLKLPIGEEKIEIIKNLFLRFKGDSPVFLNLILNDKRIKIKPRNYGINLSEEFLYEIKRTIGEDCIRQGI
ncbi:MAG: hypothetical protein N2589_00545, partial [bacterium]|nr:hypothetical protein [bacterium]